MNYKYSLLLRWFGISMSLLIWLITLSSCDENLDNELNVENAVVLILVESFPERNIIESRMNFTGEPIVFSTRALMSASFIPAVISLI